MGGSSPSHTSQTTKVELSPEQKQIFGIAFPYAQKYAETPLQQFQGSGVVGFDPHEISAQQELLNTTKPTMSALSDNAIGTHQILNNDVLGNVGFQLDVANNPYLKAAADSMMAGMNKNLTEQQLPAVRSGATQSSGMYSGASSKSGIAEGQAIAGTNTAISDAITKAMLSQYNTGMGNLAGAAKLNLEALPTLQASTLKAPSIEAAVGGQNRALEQAKLDEQIRNFYTGQSLPFLQAQELMGLISGMPGGQTVSNATGSVPQANPVMQGIGLLAALMML